MYKQRLSVFTHTDRNMPPPRSHSVTHLGNSRGFLTLIHTFEQFTLGDFLGGAEELNITTENFNYVTDAFVSFKQTSSVGVGIRRDET